MEIEPGLVLFQPRPLLHELDEVAPVYLHQIVDVDTRQLERDQDLDDEFVPGRR